MSLGIADGLSADVLVIGGGAAGLRAAIECSECGARTILVLKGNLGVSGTTAYASSNFMSFSAALRSVEAADSVRTHAEDIVALSGGLANRRLAEAVAREAPDRLRDLVAMGARFKKLDVATFDQVHTDGSSYPRGCHRGASTCQELLRVLGRYVVARDISVFEGIMVTRLLIRNNRITGVVGVDTSEGRMVQFGAKAVILATGGPGAVYRYNAYPRGMTGDGLVMALEAGARLRDLEFVEMGPTLLLPIKFAVGNGIWELPLSLTNAEGKRFLRGYLPSKTRRRDILRRKSQAWAFSVDSPGRFVDLAVYSEVLAGKGTEHGTVLLDLTGNSLIELNDALPETVDVLRANGFNVAAEPMGVTIAASHFLGGVRIDSHGQTSIPGLFACGECAGGVFGAAKAAGDALPAGQVFAVRAGRSAARFASEHKPLRSQKANVEAERERISRIMTRDGPESLSQVRIDLSRLVWENAGPVRTGKGLKRASVKLADFRDRARRVRVSSVEELVSALELANMLVVSEAILLSALRRAESRGFHYRKDCPKPNDRSYKRYIRIRRIGQRLSLAFRPAGG